MYLDRGGDGCVGGGRGSVVKESSEDVLVAVPRLVVVGGWGSEVRRRRGCHHQVRLRRVLMSELSLASHAVDPRADRAVAETRTRLDCYCNVCVLFMSNNMLDEG